MVPWCSWCLWCCSVCWCAVGVRPARSGAGRSTTPEGPVSISLSFTHTLDVSVSALSAVELANRELDRGNPMYAHHTHTHTCTHTRSLAYTHTHTRSLAHSHTHTHRLTRSIRSNGYASSQVSFGSHHGRPMTPRTPTGLSVTSPSFEYTDAPKYDDLHTSRFVHQ